MNKATKLPESLRRQLREFEKRLCVMETVIGVLGGLCGILFTYAILFLSDRFWNTPLWLRAGLTLGGGVVLASFAYYWLHHWWWRRRDTRELARLVQKQYGRLGDRLLGAVELADGTFSDQNVSPALSRAAIRQVGQEAENYDFKEAVATRRPRIYSLSFALLAILAIVTLLFFPEAGWNALRRWAKPFSAVERFTFVSIEEIPDEQIVPHGEDFEIACRLGEQSRWRPNQASCRLENQPKIETQVEDGMAVFRIPGQTAPGTLSIRIGDVSKQIAIKPVLRPELLQLTAHVVLPEYLQRPESTTEIDGGRIELLEGSKVAFEGTVSRKLRSAGLESADQSVPPFEVETDRFSTSEFVAGELDTLEFNWTDCFGLGPSEPYTLHAATVQDDPPVVECPGISRAVAILKDEVVDLQVDAEDDYGIREMWVNWSTEEDKESGVSAVRGTQTIGKGSPTTHELGGEFSFSPLTADVPEETMVTLYAYASDYNPKRKPAMSLQYRIYVLSRAKHAELVRKQMEDLQAQLDDLGREEEKLLAENRELEKLPSEKLAAEKTTAALEEHEAREQRHTEQLKRISREAEELQKEALRNKDIPEETMRRWAELTQKMKQLAENEMRQAADALRQAGDRKKQRSNKLSEATELEEQIMEALREMEEGMNSALEDMLAQSFLNRLRSAAAAEKQIASSLRQLLPEVVGMDAADLPDDKREKIAQLAARQDNTREEAEYIRDDLQGFYNRTRIASYNTVHEEMRELEVGERLQELAELISRNVGIKSIDKAESWQDRFDAWAEILQKKSGDGKAGSGQGSSPEEIDIEILIALMRARQREESLRKQTRLLDQRKDSSENYASNARELSEMQYDLASDIRPLERKTGNRELRRFIEKIDGEMMNAGMHLRKPQTDAATIAIETEIIELLSNSISSCAGQCGANALALMQAMGMQPGMGSGAGAGGGSNAGGITEAANMESEGRTGYGSEEERNVEKAAGMNAAEFPEEFRNILEAYFQALEGKR